MDTVELVWEKVALDEILHQDDTCFYAFSYGVTMCYIGISYHQDVYDEVKQTMRAFQIKTAGLSIWLGYIEKSNLQRITKRFVLDIESFLIYMNQPTFNTQHKSTYNGRDNLSIKSKGTKWLYKHIQIKNNVTKIII
jgi:hypothetical protein